VDAARADDRWVTRILWPGRPPCRCDDITPIVAVTTHKIVHASSPSMASGDISGRPKRGRSRNYKTPAPRNLGTGLRRRRLSVFPPIITIILRFYFFVVNGTEPAGSHWTKPAIVPA
jgi:hypothetical protein